MGLTYVKRYRMERALRRPTGQTPDLPRGYSLLPWADSLLAAHAEAKYQSFRGEIDANVFPCLGDREGCERLMGEIAGREGFLPQATLLLAWQDARGGSAEYCGTIQGIDTGGGVGSVQNLGITPAHRGQSLGTLLLQQAAEGFRQYGLSRISLEVTAHNAGAVRLYRRLGFRTVKTLYKTVEVVYA
jgi:hypothetical protein